MIEVKEGVSTYETDADIQGQVDETIATNVGVINPFALAEVITNRQIDWNNIFNTEEMLESIFKLPYEDLFDPEKGSPLYLEMEFVKGEDHMHQREFEATDSEIINSITARVDTSDSSIMSKVKESAKLAREATVTAGDAWVDIGDFFVSGADLFDPVQGAVGDCYLIAALSAVAWSRPYVIGHRTRPTNTSGGFTNMIEFFANGKAKQIEVTDKLLMWGTSNNPKYARSSDLGEIWPGLYEKAYAKWKTGHTGDTPNISSIAGGDPVRACAELTGLNRYYFATTMSADDIWTKVRANSMTGSTFNPMVAWTWPSGSAAPGGVNYNTANLVANHAYSIHGWDYRNKKKYVVLRNPWGTKEATVGIANGTWVSYDRAGHYGPGFWRHTNLADNDGLFALEAATFKKYFRGFGLVK